MAAADLDTEIKEADEGDGETRARTVITKHRACKSWYPWKEFCNPKEHFEEFKMLQLEKRREEFEDRMEESRKAFELKLDERNNKERRRTDKIMVWLAIAAIIFAVAEVVSGVPAIQRLLGLD